MADTASPTRASGLGAFLRLWFVIWFSYALLKFAFNLLVLNAIDMRFYSIVELVALPFGQREALGVAKRAGEFGAARQAPRSDG